MAAENQQDALQNLVAIMALLRSPQGCHWDREQTPESLKKHILEETYELLEAIDNGEPREICDELGDLLLQVVFQAQIFSERNEFSLSDVAQSISQKLIRRHPHIFSDAGHTEQEQRWEEIKRQERAARGQSNKLAQRLPKTLPALKRASKAAKTLPCLSPCELVDQIILQLRRIRPSLSGNQAMKSALEDELAKVLFGLVQLTATIGLDGEDLLRKKTTQLIAEIDSENNL